jgi:hypothetical protein
MSNGKAIAQEGAAEDKQWEDLKKQIREIVTLFGGDSVHPGDHPRGNLLRDSRRIDRRNQENLTDVGRLGEIAMSEFAEALFTCALIFVLFGAGILMLHFIGVGYRWIRGMFWNRNAKGIIGRTL